VHWLALFHQQNVIGKLRGEIDVVRDDECCRLMLVAAIS
jgi:hypothetical protein